MTEADIAVLEFYAKWDIEQGYDYVQVSASIDGGISWIPLCGQYTVIGNDNQDENQPLYDGVQNSWVKETMDLSDFIGENIQLRFSLVSDNFTRGDGFKFDDLKVLVVQDSVVQTGIGELRNQDIRVYPNPAKELLYVQHDFEGGAVQITIQNVLGQELVVKQANSSKTHFEIGYLSAGTYFVFVKREGVAVAVKQFIIF